MTAFDDVARVHGIATVELTTWIRHRWVRPRETSEGYVFDAIDEARVVLLRELRHDLSLGDEATDVVLSLLDQLYAARRMLKSVDQALAALPPDIRDEMRRRLGSPS